MKNKKWLAIFMVLLIVLIGGLLIYDANLDVYKSSKDGTLIYKNNEFRSGYDTYKKYYANGERTFELDKLIGKTSNSKFIGLKESVWKIKGESEEEVVFVKGLKIESVYERK
jgi:hypothetical protein